MISKNSTNEDIITFAKKYLKEEGLKKIKDENLKGNELFFFDKLGLFGQNNNKLKKALEEIKEKNIDIISFNINLNESSSKEEIDEFLKLEMKITDKTVLNKLENIDGYMFININEEDEDILKDFGFKLGERRKLSVYLKNTKVNITNEINQFLKDKFQITEESVELINDNGITWDAFYNLNNDDYENFNIKDEIKEKIQQFINEKKLKLKEFEINKNLLIKKFMDEIKLELEKDKILEEDNSKQKVYHLIEIRDYITSQKDINKCPFNKRDGFAELCKDMNIIEKENCSTIDYDSANKNKLRIVSLWGSKEGIFEFFESKKMNETKKYFEDKINDKSGIFLLINEDKSFGYIVIYPGNMKFFYKKMDQPQKGFLLSLIRMGLYICQDSVICLTEKQQKEFNFTAIKSFNSNFVITPNQGRVKLMKNEEETFNFGEERKIEFIEEKSENVIDIKLNGNLIFISLKTNERIENETYSNIPINKIDFKENNINFSDDFNYEPFLFYLFVKKFTCFQNLIKKIQY